MRTTLQHHGRRGILAAAAAVLALAGGLLVAVGLGGHDGPPQPDQDRVAVTAAEPAPDRVPPTPSPVAPVPSAASAAPATDLGPLLAASAPVAIDIPSIDVHVAGLVPLSVGADGVLPPPSDFATAGWYTGGPTPGQLGPAVIAAHVDGPDGPAVFYRLGELTAGAEVMVTREDGSVAKFTIDAVESYPKAEFPTSRVYGNTTNRAELRLITCGGAFDRSIGHYVDNVIAFGHLVA
ncbi:MAG: class F sortase [Cellulomonas sp.]